MKNISKLELLYLVGSILFVVPIAILCLSFLIALSYFAFQQNIIIGILITSIFIGCILIIIYSFLSDD